MSDAETRRERNTETRHTIAGLRVPLSTFPADLTPRARRGLTGLLIVKSIIEMLIVCGLAASFFYFAFNSSYKGALERADAAGVSGWVIDESRPGSRVEVQLYVDGRFVASTVADRPRTDIPAGSTTDGRCGFFFDTPENLSGDHEARVYTVHESGAGARRTLQLVAGPLRFRVAR